MIWHLNSILEGLKSKNTFSKRLFLENKSKNLYVMIKLVKRVPKKFCKLAFRNVEHGGGTIKRETTYTVIFALCIMFSVLPFAAAEPQNIGKNNLNQKIGTNEANNTGLKIGTYEYQISELQELLKNQSYYNLSSKNIEASKLNGSMNQTTTDTKTVERTTSKMEKTNSNVNKPTISGWFMPTGAFDSGYEYRWHYVTWLNYDPSSGRWGVLRYNPKDADGGELTSSVTGVDFDGVSGYEKEYNPRWKLKRA